MLFFGGKRRLAFVKINGLVNIDQTFDPTSEHPQSGIAVEEAIQRGLVGVVLGNPMKVCRDVAEISCAESESHTHRISIGQEGKRYTVCSVTVTDLNGETLLCDVEITDYASSGNDGVCEVALSFFGEIDETVSIVVSYNETEVQTE